MLFITFYLFREIAFIGQSKANRFDPIRHYSRRKKKKKEKRKKEYELRNK